MKICLIRHGETDWNAMGKWQGREDIPLNTNGIKQAERCGAALKQGRWGAIFTSPLCRAKKTAEVLAGALNISRVYEEDDLTERDYGAASGLLASERSGLFPDGMYDGMEDWEALRDRVCGAIVKCAERGFPDNIIIVSHGSAINSVLAELSGHAIGTGKTNLLNTCVNVLEYKDGALTIVCHNQPAEALRFPL